MAVRIRLKKLGRRHRPFFRLCAIDGRSPRDGRVLEELGTYDPMIRETDARAVLNGPRIDYWLGVGAQPSDKVKVLIKKYGTNGTHLDQQKDALERIKPKPRPVMERPVAKEAVAVTEEATEESPAEQAETTGEQAETTGETSENEATG